MPVHRGNIRRGFPCAGKSPFFVSRQVDKLTSGRVDKFLLTQAAKPSGRVDEFLLMQAAKPSGQVATCTVALLLCLLKRWARDVSCLRKKLYLCSERPKKQSLTKKQNYEKDIVVNCSQILYLCTSETIRCA